MTEVVLVGRGRDISTVPGAPFREAVLHLPERMGYRRAFMTDAPKRVREYVVRELRAGLPLTPARIGTECGLSVPRVVELLADLERHLFFLVRAEDGAVSWAFPVTSEATPHR